MKFGILLCDDILKNYANKHINYSCATGTTISKSNIAQNPKNRDRGKIGWYFIVHKLCMWAKVARYDSVNFYKPTKAKWKKNVFIHVSNRSATALALISLSSILLPRQSMCMYVLPSTCRKLQQLWRVCDFRVRNPISLGAT